MWLIVDFSSGRSVAVFRFIMSRQQHKLLELAHCGHLDAVKGLIQRADHVSIVSPYPVRSCCKQTALYAACQNGHTEVAQYLLDNGASINLCVKPLGSHCDCVKLLLQYHAKANCTNTEQELLMSVAMQEHRYSIILLLLLHGATPLAPLSNISVQLLKHAELQHAKVIQKLFDENFINLTSESTFMATFDFAFKHGSFEVAQRVILNDSFSKIEKLYPEAAYYSAKNNWPNILSKLLEKRVDINALTEGQTPLYVACKEGHVHIVILLLNNGADPNVPNKLTDSNCFSFPIQIAVQYGNAMIVDMLLQKGTKLNPPGEPLLHIASSDAAKWKTVDEPGETRSVEHMLPTIKLLLQQGVNVNDISDEGDTVLYHACKSQQLELVQVLLEAGADVNLLSNGLHPLIAVCDFGNAELISLLVKAGADVECNKGRPCKSPLAVACFMQNVALVGTLLEHGANPNLASSCDSHPKHRFPLFIAVDKGNIHITTSLLNANADVNAVNDECKSIVYLATENMISSRNHSMYEMRKKMSTIRLLLEHGADVNVQMPDGCTLLYEVVTALADTQRRCVRYRTCVIEMLHLLVKYGAMLEDSSSLPENICRQSVNSGTLMALSTFDSRDEFIVDLFRAGAGFQLIALCCHNIAKRFQKAKSIRLCQSVILAGYAPSLEELQNLQLAAVIDNTAGHLIQQLVIWLNEDRQQVPSLFRQCRVVIRRQLSVAVHFQTILPAIHKLPLPMNLKLYLLFDGIMTEVDLCVNKEQHTRKVTEETLLENKLQSLSHYNTECSCA